MTKSELRNEIIKVLEGRGINVCSAGSKGDGFFIEGMGFVKFEAARKMAGLEKHEAQKREYRPRISAYGDYATIAMINGIKA